MATQAVMLERADIQGIVARAYRTMRSARFWLLRINEGSAARTWLAGLAAQVTDADTRPETTALNVAFTHDGLQALGLSDATLDTFSFEFREGMTAEHRRHILGDHDENAPEKWVWGGPHGAPVHVLLMMYATDEQELERFHRSISDALPAGAVEPVGAQLDTHILIDEEAQCAKEHFGFCDGASQPAIEGLKEAARPEHQVRAGEILLGYPNEYGRLTVGPVVAGADDPGDVLPAVADGGDERDLGRNGTYLVFRQLYQDVKGFWAYLDDATRHNGVSDADARTLLAAKMVGRWPSGAPLVKAPDHDRPELGKDNDFGYHHEDPDGAACPVGAHIRRTNPRDSLSPGPGTKASIAVNRRHQILRRGRTYGAPLADSLDPDDYLATDGSGERGLHFICLNANISRQFEFIQQTWVNNPKFAGLYEDTDPLIGTRNPPGPLTAGTFTVPGEPVRRRVTGLPPFVEVRGGAYFFLPGMRALRYLASTQ